jgi:hypothetical protein
MHAISRVSSRAFKGPSAPQEKLIFIKPEKARMTSSRHHPRSHSPRRPPAGPRDPDQFFSPCSPECAASAACDQVSRRSCAHGAESLEGEEGRMLFFGAMFPIPSSHFKTFAHAELKWLSDACRTIALRGTDRKENERFGWSRAHGAEHRGIPERIPRTSWHRHSSMPQKRLFSELNGALEGRALGFLEELSTRASMGPLEKPCGDHRGAAAPRC